MNIENPINIIIICCMIVLAVCILFCLARVIKGPSIADRLVGGNMIGTMTILIISLLSVLLGEGYLVDVAMLYAMLSFLAVVVITKIYMGNYNEKQLKEEAAAAKEAEASLNLTEADKAESDTTAKKVN